MIANKGCKIIAVAEKEIGVKECINRLKNNRMKTKF